MKIGIVGSGAIGGLIGAFLTASGEEVTMIDTREDLIDLVNKEGQTISVVKTGETINVRPKMVHAREISSLPLMDLVICCTKGFATREAMQNARQIIGSDSIILSIQNGWGNVEQIREALIPQNPSVIAGVFFSLVSPEQGKPNHLTMVFGTDIIKGGAVNFTDKAELIKIADVFNRAKLKFTIVDNYVDIIWNKLIGNTAMPVGAVLGLTNDEYLSYENSRDIILRVFEESIAVARAMGVKFDNPQNPIGPHLLILENFRAAAGKNMRGSMPLDIIHGRKTEIDSINGAVVREGKKRGVATPMNECMVLLVKAMEERNTFGKLYNYDRNKLNRMLD